MRCSALCVLARAAFHTATARNALLDSTRLKYSSNRILCCYSTCSLKHQFCSQCSAVQSRTIIIHQITHRIHLLYEGMYCTLIHFRLHYNLRVQYNTTELVHVISFSRQNSINSELYPFGVCMSLTLQCTFGAMMFISYSFNAFTLSFDVFCFSSIACFVHSGGIHKCRL